MSITTKEIPEGPRPLSRAELIDRIHELKRDSIHAEGAYHHIRAKYEKLIMKNVDIEAELHFVKQKFVYVYPEESK